MRRGKQVGGSVGVGCRGETGGVRGGRVEGVKVGMEIGCHVVGRDGGRGSVLCVRADQCRVPVNSESLILINDQRALGAAAVCVDSTWLRPHWHRLETRP